MGKWATVTGMPLKPYCCIACGSTPVDQEEGPKQAYFCEAVDVNWGDSVYLCETCVRVLGQLSGMMDPDEAKDLKRELRDSKEEYANLLERHEALSKRVDRMLDGVKAKKETQASRKKVKASA